MGDNRKAELYPRYCFHLSPTWAVWCFFKVADIHALDKHDGFEGEQFYFYRNLPIKWVRIVGLVVAIDDFAGRRVFTIDDSSGACIEVLETLVDPPKLQEKPAGSVAGHTADVAPQPAVPKVSAYPDIDVGHIVDVKGGLSEFRNERQITIEKLVLVRSTMEEVVLWEKRTKFRQDVLQTSWEISAKDLRKARKEAERDKARAERKNARISMREDPKVTRYGGTDRTATKQQKEPLVQQPVNLRELLQENKGKFKSLGL